MALGSSADSGPARVFHVVEQPWRWFDEIRIGETFDCGAFTFDRQEIVDFATRFDPQPFHVDPGAARASLVGELFASSLHTLAASVGIFVRSTRHLEIAIGMALRQTDLPRPACADVPFGVHGRWMSARLSRSRPGLGIVTWEAETRMPGGETVLRFGSTIMLREGRHQPVAALREA